MRLKHSLRGGALLVVAVAGCTVTTTNGSTNNCSADSTVSGCTGTSIGYSCNGSAAPTATNPSLNCSAGVPGNAGSTLYCCDVGTAATSNGVDAGGSCSTSTGPTSCTANSTEYACSGSATPAEANPALTCGPGIAGSGGSTLYCCAIVDAATGIDSSVADAGGIDAVGADGGACAVAATTGSASCDQCLDSQCCTALVACDTQDDAGVSDAGASACEQLLGCILDCVAGNADAGVDGGSLSDCQSVCNPSYTSTEQQNATAVLTCQSSNCSSSCQ